MDNYNLGLTVGSGLLETDLFDEFDSVNYEASETVVPAYIRDNVIVIQRHQSDEGYVPPHKINHEAHFRLFRESSVDLVIGVQSVGSLSERIEPGSFVLPSDFIYPWVVETSFDDERGHVVPEFSDKLRNHLIRVLAREDQDITKESVYVQTRGPRFETPAEARMLAEFGDVVGMTAASEVILASELDIPYATVCSVDNYVNGISGTELTLEKFEEGVRKNRPIVKKITKLIIQSLGKGVA